MTLQRFILETGFGTDQYGQDATKAACRAVEDAIRKVALPLFGTLGIETDEMRVVVTVGVSQPETLDKKRVASVLPHGQVTVKAIKGGLDVTNPDTGQVITVAVSYTHLTLPTIA